MQIHVVQQGQTLYSIGLTYGVSASVLARLNGLSEPYRLAVGQSLLILRPQAVYTVREGDTLYSISRSFGVDLRTLWQNNPTLGTQTALYPGQTVILRLESQASRQIEVTGYAYPFVSERVLRQILPYATELCPFTYGFSPEGELVLPNDEKLLSLVREYGVRALLHLSTLTENDRFSAERGELLLSNETLQNALITAVLAQLELRGYGGADVDFEYLGAALAEPYAQFLRKMQLALRLVGGRLLAAVAPKTSDTQPGQLYEGHDYAAIAAAVDAMLVMTYEWGYTYSSPQAVAPLPSVRRVLDYAVSRIPREKMLLGFPNYGYDWPLPYERGETKATSVGNEAAAALAVRYGAQILYDETVQTPYFHYTDEYGTAHEVWFEDVRSSLAKLRLIDEYGLHGVGYWNFMRPFAANFFLLRFLYGIEAGKTY